MIHIIKKILRKLHVFLCGVTTHAPEYKGVIDVIIGPQWGDEGKGKIVDKYATDGKYDMGVRFQGGNNAGHSLVVNGKTVVLHTIPSTIFTTKSLIGDGVVINPVDLVAEIATVKASGGDPLLNLIIGDRAHIILPTHIMLDKAQEEMKGGGKIGSTQKGIAPVYTDRSARNGIFIGEIFHQNFKNHVHEIIEMHKKQLSLYSASIDENQITEAFKTFYTAIEEIKKYKFVSTPYFMNDCLKRGEKILAEGAQATMLDLSFGTYPYVTSSRTVATAIPSELGVSVHYLRNVVGVFKAYLTKVGAGPFPTKIEGDIAKQLQDAGHEFGSTTGRPRDTGWLDLPLMKYAIMINGITELVLTKLDIFDVLTTDIKVCTGYKIGDIVTDRIDFNLVDKIDKITPVYKTFPSWHGEKTEGVQEFDDLPDNAQAYVEFLEKELGVPITFISVGPGKNDVIEYN